MYKMSQYKTFLLDQGATISITTSGYLIGFNGIPQGVTNGSRIGNRVRLRYARLRMVLYSNDANDIVWRVAIVRSRGPLLALADMPLSSAVSVFDFDKMELLWERTIHTAFMDTTDRGIVPINKTLWLNRTVIYDDTNNTPIKGQYYLFIWASDIVVPSPYVQFTVVTSFIDV